MAKHRQAKTLPPWFLGLLLAMLIFALTLFLLDLFGYGDDPVVGEGTSAVAAALL